MVVPPTLVYDTFKYICDVNKKEYEFINNYIRIKKKKSESTYLKTYRKSNHMILIWFTTALARIVRTTFRFTGWDTCVMKTSPIYYLIIGKNYYYYYGYYHVYKNYIGKKMIIIY